MFRKLALETGIYGLSTVLGRLTGYLLVPIYTSVLKTEDYGIVSELYSYVGLLAVIYYCGMGTTFFRFATKQENDPQIIFNTCISFLIISSLFLSSLLILFSNPLATLLGYPYSNIYILLFVILMGVDSVMVIPFGMLRVQGKALHFASIKVFNIIINVLLNIFFLIVCPKIYNGEWLPFLQHSLIKIYNPNINIFYIILSNMIASCLNVLLLWPILKKFKFSLNITRLKSLCLYAYPLIFSAFFSIINEVIDKPLIKWLLPEGFYPDLNSQDSVGIYAACYKLSIFINLFVQAFSFAAEPFFFSQAKNKNSPEVFSELMKYFIVFSLLMVMGLKANLAWISELFIRNEIYRMGIDVVPILFFANVFLGIYYNLSIWFKVSDKTQYAAIIGGIGALITLIGNFLLIPLLGYYGSAIATLLCYGSMTFVSYWLGQKHYPIPYKISNAVLYFGLAISFTIISDYIKQRDILKDFFIQNIFFIGFLICVCFFERKKLRDILFSKKLSQ